MTQGPWTGNDRNVTFTPIHNVPKPPDEIRERTVMEVLWDVDGSRLELPRGTRETEARKAQIAAELASHRPVSRAELDAARNAEATGVDITTNTAACQKDPPHDISLYVAWDGIRRCRRCRDEAAAAELADKISKGAIRPYFG